MNRRQFLLQGVVVLGLSAVAVPLGQVLATEIPIERRSGSSTEQWLLATGEGAIDQEIWQDINDTLNGY